MIEGERKEPEARSTAEFRRLAYGKFSTSVTLPNGVDTERVHCHLENGILQVTLPVSEQLKPRVIPIRTGMEQRSIAA